MAASLTYPTSSATGFFAGFSTPADWSELGDEALIVAYLDGSGTLTVDDLFEELYRRHRSRVAQWCLRFMGDRETAADMVQEVFLKAYRNLRNFRGDSKFSTWLFVIARNHCLNVVTRPGADRVFVESDTAARLPDPGAADALADMLREQTRSRLWTCIKNLLSRTEADVMMLHYGEEVPLAGVTRQLGLTNPSGAKAYIVSARRKLDLALKPRRAAASRRQPEAEACA